VDKPIERKLLAYVLTAHDPMQPVCIANSFDWLQVVGLKDTDAEDRDMFQKWLLEIAECEGTA
jgi:hypothetical protein